MRLPFNCKITEKALDYFISFWLYFKVKFFCIKEAREIRCRFLGFMPYECAFRKAYRFRNPFRINKKFLKQRGESNVNAYGETPLPVFAQIAHECGLGKEDTVIEMGCGRGKGVFFLSYLTGCSAIGIDWIPSFVQTAMDISISGLPVLPVSFRCEMMESSDFSNASVIYLYGTCLSDEEIHSLVKRFESLSSLVKIITVSYPLSDYSSDFITIKQFTALFPWGEAEIYISNPC